jgi:trigger factor
VYEKIPQIQMPDYKKFNIQKFSDEVKEQEVESEFNRYISKDIMLFPKEEGDVEKGDNVNIDFKGMFDKVPFPGGTGKNFDLIIGSAAFIPGFEEQLIGMKKGETKIIDVSFPSDYNEKAYAGKKAQFEVTINSISTVEKPEMNKQYFEKMKLENVNNEKEFKEYIRKQIADYKKYHNLQEFEKQFSEALIENSVVEYFPVILIAREKERIDKETDRIAKEKNMNKKEYLASVGYTEDKLYQNGLSLTAERNIKLILGIEKISDELKIVVTKEDIDDYFAKLAKLYGLTIEDVNEKYGSYIANIESFLFKQKIFSEILDKFYR